jgi:hypothetical protein
MYVEFFICLQNGRHCLPFLKVILLVRENNKWLIKYINNNGILVRNYITSDEQVGKYLGGLK